MKIRINSGRTVIQGSHVDQKNSPEYFRETSTIRLNPVDMMEIGIDDGERIKARTDNLSIVLRALSDDSIKRGTGFLPLGPYANFLVGGNTHSTGMPDFKEADADIEATVDTITTVGELMQQLGGVPYRR
ncbi:MAG: molybdopterin dinucleotide-binding protein [Methanomicrobiales archaeon]|nr:molybdopterin dinucleotide-binding protein [Methanomicrobiales archaeon]